MQDLIESRESDLSIATADSVTRREFEWTARVGTETVSIARTAQSSPVWIQQNN